LRARLSSPWRSVKHIEVEFKPEGAALRETPETWLEKLFEFTLCEECGGDLDDHQVCLIPGIGTYFARCLKTPNDDEDEKPET
jgi:hypothetical protein